MFGFGKKVEETRTKVNNAADQAAGLAQNANQKLDEFASKMNSMADDARAATERFEKKANEAAEKLEKAEKIKIALLGFISVCAAVVAVNSCRD